MTTYKPFVERVGLALAALTDAKTKIPDAATGLQATLDAMIADGRRAYDVFNPANKEPLDVLVMAYRPEGQKVMGKDLTIGQLAGLEGAEAGTKAWIENLPKDGKARALTLLDALQFMADTTGKQQKGQAMIEGVVMRYVANPSSGEDPGMHIVPERWFQEYTAKAKQAKDYR